MIDIKKLDIKTANKHLIEGDFSAVELAENCIKNIKERNLEINAYIEIYDDILEKAAEADDKIKNKKEISILTGIPLALKDNILYQGKRVTAGSKILENYTAIYDATVIKKLKTAGAVFVGRTNLDEFAMGSSTENSAFGVTKNPYDMERVAGGSSGGSAASVASLGALAALGSDKPTYGAISRYGLIAMGSSLDQIGPIGKTVSDVEIIFNAIRGDDKMDSTSLFDKSQRISGEDREEKTIGIPADFISDGIDKDIFENFNDSIEKLKSLGYKIKEITLPNIKHSLAVYYIIMPAEASANLARFDGVRYGLRKEGTDITEDYFKTREAGFGIEVKRRIMLGTHILSSGYYDAYYNKANAVRNIIKSDFDKAFSEVSAVITPTTPTPAFKIGEKSNPLSMYLADIFTVPANLTGMPAISIPSGIVARGQAKLPVGLQIMTPYMKEDILFNIGRDFLDEK